MISMNQISVQRANPEQAGQLSKIAFAAKAYWGYPKRWMELWRPQLTFSPEYIAENESWMAVADDTPIGFYTFHEKNGNAWIGDLWVLPDFIGKGVGKLLFSHAVGFARQRGYHTLQLEADPNAVGFYEKMGMKKIGERVSAVEGSPRTLPIMELEL
jgi:GNAT superfamily N-acetyltransferase